jgi:hypothetical protein
MTVDFAAQNRILRGFWLVLALMLTLGAAHGAECTGVSDSSALTGAQKAVRKLYAMPALVDARNGIEEAAISKLQPYVTDGLAAALRDFSAALSKADQSTDLSTKSPYPTGPIFFSNYEGMDTFNVADASAADQTIRVKVEMDFKSEYGNAQWTDLAVLRCEGGEWKLDDIIFDPNQTAGPSLRDRIAIR